MTTVSHPLRSARMDGARHGAGGPGRNGKADWLLQLESVSELRGGGAVSAVVRSAL